MSRYTIGQMSLFGHAQVIAFGCEGFDVRTIGRDVANDLICRNHYSGKVYPLSTEHHGIYIDGELLGVLQWGAGMNPDSGSSIVSGTKNGEWLELNRMWLDDAAPRNSESRAISFSIKLLRKTRPEVQWIQSFADERCGGLGVVYQACSFDYLGEHTSVFWELDGQWYHNISATVRGDALSKRPSAAHLQANLEKATRHELRQFRYWKGLTKNAKRCLMLPILPYVKRDGHEDYMQQVRP